MTRKELRALTKVNDAIAEPLKRLLDLADAIDVYRSAECDAPVNPCRECRGSTQTGYVCPRCGGKQVDPEQCDGDNHTESCAVKLAMDDVLSASDHTPQ